MGFYNPHLHHSTDQLPGTVKIHHLIAAQASVQLGVLLLAETFDQHFANFTSQLLITGETELFLQFLEPGQAFRLHSLWNLVRESGRSSLRTG